jgi:hypothetical protein
MKSSQNSQLNALNKDAQLASMAERIGQLEHQLDWFKRQLFGRKSEKQLFDNSHQKPLFGTPDGLQPAPEAQIEVKPHKRKSNTKHPTPNTQHPTQWQRGE